MATNLKGAPMEVPCALGMRFGIVVSQWNKDITEKLLDGAIKALIKSGCREEDIDVKWVPGTFELALGAKFFCTYTEVDAIVVLGCVIQGDTRHFDFVCQGVTQGVMQLQLEEQIPIGFGVLTTNNLEQAQERAGGKLGNKGAEAAETAIIMVETQAQMQDLFLENNAEELSTPTVS